MIKLYQILIAAFFLMTSLNSTCQDRGWLGGGLQIVALTSPSGGPLGLAPFVELKPFNLMSFNASISTGTKHNGLGYTFGTQIYPLHSQFCPFLGFDYSKLSSNKFAIANEGGDSDYFVPLDEHLFISAGVRMDLAFFKKDEFSKRKVNWYNSLTIALHYRVNEPVKAQLVGGKDKPSQLERINESLSVRPGLSIKFVWILNSFKPIKKRKVAKKKWPWSRNGTVIGEDVYKSSSKS